MDNKDGEITHVFKFDGDKTKWLQWSMKTMMHLPRQESSI